ncbi:MAG: flavodoxin domain-containing protein [Granulosicoccaceae bacterium]|jgi:flavodoxin
MAKIQVLVGTVNGTAWQSARAVAHVLNHQGHEVRVNDEPGAQDLQQDQDEVLLICCSTTGEGELPHNIYPLFLALDEQAVDLQGRHYGVITLGDSGYRHFAQAGYMMENALYLSGAKRVGDVCTLDAKRVANHPLAAAQWANEWVASLPS